MKKPICLILAALLTLPLYCACADDSENGSSEAGEASYESGWGVFDSFSDGCFELERFVVE